jgi:hypothetical protein
MQAEEVADESRKTGCLRARLRTIAADSKSLIASRDREEACNFRRVLDVVASMMLWGRTLAPLVCLLGLVAAEPALDPVTVCQAVANFQEYDGKMVGVLGRYSFREAGPQKGRWLGQEGCGGMEHAVVRLTLNTSDAPKPPDQVALDEVALEKKLGSMRQRTALGKFRFGSPDYDRWAVVIGRLERRGEEFQLVYRGDGAVFFLTGN